MPLGFWAKASIGSCSETMAAMPSSLTSVFIREVAMTGKHIAITPKLVAKVRSLHEYGLTLREIASRLSVAESTAHKILRAK